MITAYEGRGIHMIIKHQRKGPQHDSYPTRWTMGLGTAANDQQAFPKPILHVADAGAHDHETLVWTKRP